MILTDIETLLEVSSTWIANKLAPNFSKFTNPLMAKNKSMYTSGKLMHPAANPSSQAFRDFLQAKSDIKSMKQKGSM